MKPMLIALGLLAAATAAHGQVQPGGPSQEYNGELAQRPPAQSPATDRIIVKWRSSAARLASSARAQKASVTAGVPLSKQQSLTDQLEVLQAQQMLSGEALEAALERLQADPAVEYASPDLRRQPHALTSDPLLMQQWYLLGDQPAATRTHLAWDVTMGSTATVVAVLDTGVRFEHPDLGQFNAGGKLLPGYDFVRDALFANDGDGPDADASDPGDWVDDTDMQNPAFSRCETSRSSWHGTRVSGLIGALTDNAAGVAGAGWNTAVLPVRVLGKCGGRDSDIIAGMRWAAGLPVSGAPINPSPAKIINLSLGGTGSCSAVYQSTVNEITSRGVLIVVSAGNDAGPVASPANCSGVLSVAALRQVGTKVGFSNLGMEVGIGAPGGNCVNPSGRCLFPILVATNTGETTPATSGYTGEQPDGRQILNVGTSFSAPLAAAAAALMHSVNSVLTPPQFITLLKESAAVFPVNGDVQSCRVPVGPNDLQREECNCTTQTCGAGMLNTNAAVIAAQNPLAIFNTSGAVTSGASVALDGSGSFAANGRSLSTFQWSIENLTGSAPVIMSPSQPTTTLQISGDSAFTLRLTVTDDQGGQDVENLALATPTAPSAPVVTPPNSGGGGGGGGGSLGWEVLALALLARLNGRRKRKNG